MPTKEYHFQKLTPINNADISVYEEAINFVFENSDIKNVAISGPYSYAFFIVQKSLLQNCQMDGSKMCCLLHLIHMCLLSQL